MDVWQVDQGDTATFTAVLHDATGAVYTGYAGTEPITATVWPGDEQAPILSVAVAEWLEADAGSIDVAISVSASMVPATYVVKLEIANAAVFKARLEVGESSAATTARTAHVTLRHLRKHYARVDKLLSATDDPTALEARADAWDWLVGLLHAHYRGGSGLATDFAFVPGLSFGGLGWPLGLYRDGRRSAVLEGWLNPTPTEDDPRTTWLDLTTEVLDCMACYALAQICGGQVDAEDKKGYGAFANRFAARAELLATTIIAEIDSNGDGVNDVTIRLGSADTLES